MLYVVPWFVDGLFPQVKHQKNQESVESSESSQSH